MLDPMDTFLQFEKLAHDANLPNVISDYPETVRNTLILFVQIFDIPETFIPPKRIPSRFNRWVGELDKLYNEHGENLEQRMRKASKKRRGLIPSPASIFSLMTEIKNKEEEEKQQMEIDSPEVASEEARLAMLRKLRNTHSRDDDKN